MFGSSALMIQPLVQNQQLFITLFMATSSEEEIEVDANVQQCSEIDSALHLLVLLRTGEHEEVLARLPTLLCRQVLK